MKADGPIKGVPFLHVSDEVREAAGLPPMGEAERQQFATEKAEIVGPKPWPYAHPLFCGECDHAWAPEIYIPMECSRYAKVLIGLAHCPRCGGTDVKMGTKA